MSTHTGNAAGYSGFGLSHPFAEGQQVTAQQSSCGDDSGWLLPPVEVGPEPGRLDPVLFGTRGARMYEGQEAIDLAALEYGSTQQVTSSFDGPLPPLASHPTDRLRYYVGGALGRPLSVGEEFEVTQVLCETPSDPTLSPPVFACSLLPPVEIVQPNDGDRTVQTTGQTVTGSTVRIYSDDEGREIGDSGEGTISLDRELDRGETIWVMRELPGCAAGEHYVYVVD